MTQHMGMMMDFSDEEEKGEESIPVVGHLQLLPPHDSTVGWLFKEFTDGTSNSHESYAAMHTWHIANSGGVYVCTALSFCLSVWVDGVVYTPYVTDRHTRTVAKFKKSEF